MQPLQTTLDLRRPAAGRTKHDRLREYLIDEMISGRLKPGQALPSERLFVESLGVARMTVCHVLTSLENDGLIRRVPRKGSFVAEDALRRLKRGQDIFALMVPETREGFYPSLLRGFEAAASKLHHHTIVCNSDNDVVRQGDIILQLLDQEVGGVAINSSDQQPTPTYQIRQLQRHGVPVVFCHRRVEGIAAPLVAIPFGAMGRMAGRLLGERGHRRVAFLAGHRSAAMEACRGGLEDAMREWGGDAAVTVVCVEERPSLREQSIRAAIEPLLQGTERPTAFFSSFDSLAETLYLLLPRLGLRVPEDVAILGFGGAWREGAIAQRLSSITVDEMATGRQAVAFLHEMRSGQRAIDDNTEVVMELGLSDGETL
jgi:GntR family transcriptional regulator, arabinose operon transcriptional repressor